MTRVVPPAYAPFATMSKHERGIPAGSNALPAAATPSSGPQTADGRSLRPVKTSRGNTRRWVRRGAPAYRLPVGPARAACEAPCEPCGTWRSSLATVTRVMVDRETVRCPHTLTVAFQVMGWGFSGRARRLRRTPTRPQGTRAHGAEACTAAHLACGMRKMPQRLAGVWQRLGSTGVPHPGAPGTVRSRDHRCQPVCP